MAIGSIGYQWLVPDKTALKETQQGIAAPMAAPAESSIDPVKAAKIDQEFADLFKEYTPEEILQEVAGDGVAGMWKFKIKQMQKQAAEKLMDEMGLTKEAVMELPLEKKVALQSKIIEEVQRRVQMMVVEQMKREFPNGLPPELQTKNQPPLVDIVA